MALSGESFPLVLVIVLAVLDTCPFVYKEKKSKTVQLFPV